MQKIVVQLEKKSYPIVIANGLFKDSLLRWPLKHGEKAVFITNDRIAPIYLKTLRNILHGYGINTDQLILPDGERSKSLDILDKIFTKLLEKQYDRNTVLIALGGGVIGDLTGFAAATYHRGIRFIQIPTTLLAQVDASIGGKTGINHILGKNMIGSFYQPISVFIDLDFLKTLTHREFSSGLAEIIKYAVAFDLDFFNWLENNLEDLLSLNNTSLMYCIYHCCKIKASVITTDEYEYGNRILLNLGHTYGHAIESCLGYNFWSHGEAVSAGIMMAISTAARLKKFSKIEEIVRVQSLLKRAKLPVCGPESMKPIDYIKYMVRDKKSRLGNINLVLPLSIGNAQVFMNVDHDLILHSIADNYKFSKFF